MNRLIAACLLPAVLSGCGLQAAIGPGLSLLGGLGGTGTTVSIPASLGTELQQAVDDHNLRIGLQQILQAPGMVAVMTPPPIVGTPISGQPIVTAPMPTPVPQPQPMAPPVVTPVPVQPIPSGPGGPIVTPNRR